MTEYTELSDTEPPSPAREYQALSRHSESLAKIQFRIEQQRLWLRWIVLVVTLLAIAGLGCLEYALLRQLIVWNLTNADTPLIVLAIAPIVAATTIIVFLLHGVFRSFKEVDIDNLPVEAVSRGMAEGSQ